jgi:hypothetical protein
LDNRPDNSDEPLRVCTTTPPVATIGLATMAGLFTIAHSHNFEVGN